MNYLLLTVFLVSTLFSKDILYSVNNSSFKKASNIYLLKGESVKLKFDVKNADIIKWYKIIPDISKFYKNANFPWERSAYKWVGFGKIDYDVVELKEFENMQIIEISPSFLQKHTSNSPHYNISVGSFWFEARAIKNGKKINSYGIKDNSNKNLSPKVFRVSFVESFDYIGYLTSFFNVPGLFGSIPYQSKNYIGVDCADLLMATKSIVDKSKLKDVNVAMLVTKLKKQATLTILRSTFSKNLKWGVDFKRGDFIAVRYTKNSQFAHIGVLYRDKNQNSLLDGEDLILHAGPESLHISPLKDGYFDGFVKILKNESMK